MRYSKNPLLLFIQSLILYEKDPPRWVLNAEFCFCFGGNFFSIFCSFLDCFVVAPCAKIVWKSILKEISISMYKSAFSCFFNTMWSQFVFLLLLDTWFFFSCFLTELVLFCKFYFLFFSFQSFISVYEDYFFIEIKTLI